MTTNLTDAYGTPDRDLELAKRQRVASAWTSASAAQLEAIERAEAEGFMTSGLRMQLGYLRSARDAHNNLNH